MNKKILSLSVLILLGVLAISVVSAGWWTGWATSGSGSFYAGNMYPIKLDSGSYMVVFEKTSTTALGDVSIYKAIGTNKAGDLIQRVQVKKGETKSLTNLPLQIKFVSTSGSKSRLKFYFTLSDVKCASGEVWADGFCRKIYTFDQNQENCDAFKVSYLNSESYYMRARIAYDSTDSRNEVTFQYKDKNGYWTDVKYDAISGNRVTIGNVEFTIADILFDHSTIRKVQIYSNLDSVSFDNMCLARSEIPNPSTAVTYQGVLEMLNNCKMIESSTSGQQNCNSVCSLYASNLICALGGLYYWNIPASQWIGVNVKCNANYNVNNALSQDGVKLECLCCSAP